MKGQPHGVVIRNLAGYPDSGFDRGRTTYVRVLWLAVWGMVGVRWWCPNRARLAILRLFGARFGQGCIVRPRVRIDLPWKLVVGDHSWIGEAVWIINPETVTIGSNVCLSQQAVVCSGSHDACSPVFARNSRPVRIDDGAWIALRGTVLSGVRVGSGATVGAGAVASRDIAPGTFVRQETAPTENIAQESEGWK